MPRKKVITTEEAVAIHEANVLASLEETNLKQTLVVHFPHRNKPPRLAQLAIWIVNSLGGIIVTKYEYKNATLNSKSRHKK